MSHKLLKPMNKTQQFKMYTPKKQNTVQQNTIHLVTSNQGKCFTPIAVITHSLPGCWPLFARITPTYLPLSFSSFYGDFKFYRRLAIATIVTKCCCTAKMAKYYREAIRRDQARTEKQEGKEIRRASAFSCVRAPRCLFSVDSASKSDISGRQLVEDSASVVFHRIHTT